MCEYTCTEHTQSHTLLLFIGILGPPTFLLRRLIVAGCVALHMRGKHNSYYLCKPFLNTLTQWLAKACMRNIFLILISFEECTENIGYFKRWEVTFVIKASSLKMHTYPTMRAHTHIHKEGLFSNGYQNSCWECSRVCLRAWIDLHCSAAVCFCAYMCIVM